MKVERLIFICSLSLLLCTVFNPKITEATELPINILVVDGQQAPIEELNCTYNNGTLNCQSSTNGSIESYTFEGSETIDPENSTAFATTSSGASIGTCSESECQGSTSQGIVIFTAPSGGGPLSVSSIPAVIQAVIQGIKDMEATLETIASTQLCAGCVKGAVQKMINVQVELVNPPRSGPNEPPTACEAKGTISKNYTGAGAGTDCAGARAACLDDLGGKIQNEENPCGEECGFDIGIPGYSYGQCQETPATTPTPASATVSCTATVNFSCREPGSVEIQLIPPGLIMRVKITISGTVCTHCNTTEVHRPKDEDPPLPNTAELSQSADSSYMTFEDITEEFSLLTTADNSVSMETSCDGDDFIMSETGQLMAVPCNEDAGIYCGCLSIMVSLPGAPPIFQKILYEDISEANCNGVRQGPFTIENYIPRYKKAVGGGEGQNNEGQNEVLL